MELRLDPDLEAQLHELAARSERAPEELVTEAVTKLIDYQRWLAEAVEEARQSLDRGEFVESSVVLARIDRRYQR